MPIQKHPVLQDPESQMSTESRIPAIQPRLANGIAEVTVRPGSPSFSRQKTLEGYLPSRGGPQRDSPTFRGCPSR